MTTTPDPKTVQQLANEHILDDARRAHDIGADVLGHFGPDALTKAEYHAYCDAIREAITTATVTVSWPDKQPQATPDGEDGPALARVLATLERHAARGSSGGEYDDADIRSILNGRMIWKTAAENATAGREPLRPEYGIRAEWTNGLSSEGSVADTLDGALRALDEFDTRHGHHVVKRELVVRPVGKWRRLDAEQQPEDGDRG